MPLIFIIEIWLNACLAIYKNPDKVFIWRGGDGDGGGRIAHWCES